MTFAIPVLLVLLGLILAVCVVIYIIVAAENRLNDMNREDVPERQLVPNTVMPMRDEVFYPMPYETPDEGEGASGPTATLAEDAPLIEAVLPVEPYNNARAESEERFPAGEETGVSYSVEELREENEADSRVEHGSPVVESVPLSDGSGPHRVRPRGLSNMDFLDTSVVLTTRNEDMRRVGDVGSNEKPVTLGGVLSKMAADTLSSPMRSQASVRVRTVVPFDKAHLVVPEAGLTKGVKEDSDRHAVEDEDKRNAEFADTSAEASDPESSTMMSNEAETSHLRLPYDSAVAGKGAGEAREESELAIDEAVESASSRNGMNSQRTVDLDLASEAEGQNRKSRRALTREAPARESLLPLRRPAQDNLFGDR